MKVVLLVYIKYFLFVIKVKVFNSSESFRNSNDYRMYKIIYWPISNDDRWKVYSN